MNAALQFNKYLWPLLLVNILRRVQYVNLRISYAQLFVLGKIYSSILQARACILMGYTETRWRSNTAVKGPHDLNLPLLCSISLGLLSYSLTLSSKNAASATEKLMGLHTELDRSNNNRKHRIRCFLSSYLMTEHVMLWYEPKESDSGVLTGPHTLDLSDSMKLWLE